MSEFSVDGQRVVVVGAARSGIAAADLLVSRGARVTVSDAGAEFEGADRLRAAGVDLDLGGHSDDVFADADLAVVSPGVPFDLPVLETLRRRGVPVIGELELAWRWLRGRVIAITGTKGKSTTTTLTGRMLQAAGLPAVVGGNIGTALSAQVDASTPDTLHVVEVSSFQLEAADTFHPWIAVLMNFSADHLDRHGSIDAYGAAKARIFAHQTASDWAVVNADDEGASRLAASCRAARFDFSRAGRIDEGIVVDGASVARRRRGAAAETLLPLSSIRLLGPHLIDDVLAAAAVGSLVGVTPAVMQQAIEDFQGLEHALEPVEDIGGVRFINDSKATNVEAAKRALESFDAGVVAIIGGRFKGGDFRDLRGALPRMAAVVAIGESKTLVRQAFEDGLPVHDAATMGEAVRAAFAAAAPGGVVLLAPACASFDMFRDYAERGRIFKDEVRRLGQEWRATREQ